MNNEQKHAFLNEELNQEQNFYWQRFTAFAALQAGCFVIFSSAEKQNWPVLVLGLVLATLWVLVQCASKGYVENYKTVCYAVRRNLDIPSPQGYRLLRWVSPTVVGIGVAVIAALFWLVVLITWLNRDGVPSSPNPDIAHLLGPRTRAQQT